MIASGIPHQDKQHAGNVATAGLELLSETRMLNKHNSSQGNLNMQIGIHSGLIVVVCLDISMPVYCLFGKTIRIASYMETTAFSGKIQISSESNTALEELGGFDTTERGFVQVPGNLVFLKL